jgi:hypothetical protein
MTWRKLLPIAVLLMTPVTLSAQSEELDTSPLEGMQVFNGNGVGTATGSVLTHTSVGVMKGTVFGAAKFTASLTDEGWSATGNGTGGWCIRGSGSIVLTVSDGSTLTMQQAGLSCNPWNDPRNLVDNATFLIVGGTGRFSEATGAGSVATGIMNGRVWIHFDGNLCLATPKSDEEGTNGNSNEGARPNESPAAPKPDEHGASERHPRGRHGG